jgi:hypothetical protein
MEFNENQLVRLTHTLLMDYVMGARGYKKYFDEKVRVSDLRVFCMRWLAENVKYFDASKLCCEGNENPDKFEITK